MVDLSLNEATETTTPVQLWARVQAHPNFQLLRPSDINWYQNEIKQNLTSWEKFSFYLEAAALREKIVARAPKDQQEQVFNRINRILDIPSHGRREELKGDKLAEMQRAVEKFAENQKIVQSKVQKLKGLPNGFEQKIWSRFMARFLEETEGDFLNETLMDSFRKSVDTTFHYLGQVLDQQERIEKMLRKEKAFLVLDPAKKTTLRESMSHNLEVRLNYWLDRKIHLRDWLGEFDDILKNQLPSRIKAFNENYNQVFEKKFWGAIPKMLPSDFPNFTTAFNFTTETEFLTQRSLEDIKKLPLQLKQSLGLDLEETLSEGFSDNRKAEIRREFIKHDPKKPSEIMTWIQKTKAEQEKNLNQAKVQITTARNLNLAGEPEASIAEYQEIIKKFGLAALRHWGVFKMYTLTEHRANEVKSLRNNLKTVTQEAARAKIEARLRKLIGDNVDFMEIHKDPAAQKARETQLIDEIENHKKSDQLEKARASAERLYHVNAIRGYTEMKTIDNAIAKRDNSEAANDNEPTNKVETSGDKMRKIQFLETCIEAAKAVKEECKDLGIPDNDPKFWGSPEGVKNRVKWLKEHGMFSTYARLNASDPNVPSTVQPGGFRFRWLDAYGEEFSGNRAETGMKYLARFKESGYKLMAIAGAFSLDWMSNQETFTPDEFIDRVNARIGRISSSKAAA